MRGAVVRPHQEQRQPAIGAEERVDTGRRRAVRGFGRRRGGRGQRRRKGRGGGGGGGDGDGGGGRGAGRERRWARRWSSAEGHPADERRDHNDRDDEAGKG